MTPTITTGAPDDALQAGPRRRRAGPCHFHCIAGSFGVGYQTQNPWLGGAGGALSGLGAGASIASTMGAGASFLGMAAAVAVPVVGAVAGAPAGKARSIKLPPKDTDDDRN